MLLLRFSETYLQANCYILSADGVNALIVDPGYGAEPWIRATLAERGLTAGAILLTHGHPDHIWDAPKLRDLGVPIYLPQPDAYRMADPLGALGNTSLSRNFLTEPWVDPGVTPLPPAMLETSAELVPGLPMRAVPAPGHSEGSTFFLFEGEVTHEGAPAVIRPRRPMALSGDVIFANGIGRTDLAGGDPYEMQWTLKTLASAIDPSTVLFPGHGPHTIMGHELTHSPYIRLAINGGLV